jgi:hypothetical protein
MLPPVAGHGLDEAVQGPHHGLSCWGQEVKHLGTVQKQGRHACVGILRSLVDPSVMLSKRWPGSKPAGALHA